MIHLSRTAKIPLHTQIYRAIRDDILAGEITAGAKLSSIRALACELNVSVNTVKNAYHQLAVEGYIENMPQSGFYVNYINKYQSLLSMQQEKIKEMPKIPDERKTYEIRYDFTYEKMSMALFQSMKWRKYVTDALMGYDVRNLGKYNLHKGELELRSEIQRYLKVSRNVHCDVEQIVLCGGIQDSIERICNIIPAAKVALESPGLKLWETIFKRHGFATKLFSVYPDYRYIDEVVKSDVKIAITTPSHQFPTGYTMSLEEKMRLLEWGASKSTIIVEDDYDCEFRYGSQPLPAMQFLDKYDCVLYIGTFSKLLFPGLRVNYMVLPHKLLEKYESVYKGYYPPNVSWLIQKTLYNFMSSDDFARHLGRARYHYKQKYYTLINACRDILGDKVQIVGTDAGLHIMLRVTAVDDADELIEAARKKEVRLYSLNRYCTMHEGFPRNLLLVGFSYIENADIYEGIRLLKEAWSQYL